MKLKLMLLIGILTLLTFDSIPLKAQSEQCSAMNNTTFQVGEALKYKVYYNWTALWVKAGEVSFDVQEGNLDGQSVYHMIGKGRTARSYDWAYKVRDHYESFIDPNSLKPLAFTRDIHEGGYKQRNKYRFFHNDSKAIVDYRYVQGKLKAEDKPIDITGCTQDILSAIYHFRSVNHQQLSVGETIPVDLVVDNRIYNVKIEFLGRDTVKTKLGTFRCVKFSPTLINGSYFKEGGEMVIWATDDENRLPIYMESPLVVGKVKAYLKSYENLRHDLTAKID